MSRRKPTGDLATLPFTKYAEYYIKAKMISRSYAEVIEAVVGLFVRWLEDDPPITQIPDVMIVDWLDAQRERGLAVPTLVSYRRVFFSLRKFAADRGIAPHPKLPTIRLPRPNPQAWTLEQMNRVLAVSLQLRGWVPHSRLSRRLWWSSLVSAAYDTGLRQGDLMSWKWSDISPDGFVMLVQSKTGEPIKRQIRPLTCDLLRHFHREEPARLTIWPRTFHRRWLSRDFKRVLRRAGVPGSFKTIRRTSATWVEVKQPGCATRHLGHLSPGMARYYIDRRYVGDEPTLPPSVEYDGQGDDTGEGDTNPFTSPFQAPPVTEHGSDTVIPLGPLVNRDFPLEDPRQGFLLDEHAAEIDRLIAAGTNREIIAERFGVHVSTLYLWLQRRKGGAA